MSKPTDLKESEELVGDLNNEGVILTQISQIEKDGYRVSYYGYNYSSNEAILKISAHGELKEELWIGLESLSIIYPHALDYTIEIKDERYKCSYKVNSLFFWDNIGDRLSYRNFEKEPGAPEGSVWASDVAKQRYVDEAYIAINYIIQNYIICEY